MRGLHREAFLKEWGLPERTSTMTGGEVMRLGWGIGGGEFLKEQALYDVWEYPEREATLFFYGARLVSWKTTRTVDELSSR